VIGNTDEWLQPSFVQYVLNMPDVWQVAARRIWLSRQWLVGGISSASLHTHLLQMILRKPFSKHVGSLKDAIMLS
jgi:hypothetical protein